MTSPPFVAQNAGDGDPAQSLPASDAIGNGNTRNSDATGTPGKGDPNGAAPESSNGVLRNVIANWAGHFVSIISGFIVPRLISDHLGDVRLGLWDFGWSIVAYMSLLTAGITASTNRYTARHRATQDWDGMNRSVSACFLIFLFTGAIATIATLALVASVDSILDPELHVHLTDARLLLLLLGLTCAVQMPLSVPSGVITGCQRYDLVNLVEGIGHFVTIVGITIALLFGANLWVLGTIVLVTEVIAGLAKYLLAHRVCPQLVLSVWKTSWASIKEVTFFGWKLLLERASRIVLYQTNSLLIMFWLGPVSLAVYSRSAALVLHAHKLLYHFGRVFTPIASGMQAKKDERGLADLLYSSGQRALLVSLPMIIMLVIMGDVLLTVWMGPDFAMTLVLPILAIGHLAAMMQTPAYYILLGLNHHGIVGLWSLIFAIIGVGISALLIGVWELGIVGAAIGVASGVTVLNLIVVPLVAARYINISMISYLLAIIPRPFMACLPLLGALLSLRWFYEASALKMLLVSLVVAGVAVGIPYYFVVPDDLRRRFLKPLTRLWNSGVVQRKNEAN